MRSPPPEGAPISRDRPIDVLVVSHSTAPWGAERRLLDLAPALRDVGVVLSLASPPGNLADAWRDLGLRYVDSPVAPTQGLRRGDDRRPSPVALARQAAITVAAARRVARHARRLRVDLLHSHALNAHVEVALAGRLARRPAVLDLHDIVVPGVGRRLLDLAARLADVVIANSAATAATVSRGRVEVINPGVDVRRFLPADADLGVRATLARDPAAPLVGILGRVDPEKGIDVVLRAVAGLDGDLASTQVAVVGAPNVAGADFVAGLRALGDELLGERARFVGPRDDVPDVLRALDVLVSASRAEPFGRTVLEAQASGVPVVGTSSGGIPEFVEDGISGLLVPPGDAGALTAALARVLTDDGLRTRVRAGGLESAASRSVPAQAAKVAAVYRSVVADRD